MQDQPDQSQTPPGSFLKADLSLLCSAVNTYVTSVDELYGHYLDSTIGFLANHQQVLERQEGARKLLPSVTDLDAIDFSYGRGNPNDPSNRLLHTTTQGEFKKRNAKGGSNHVRAAQLFVVLLYSFWETAHRAKLAEALGLSDPDGLEIPLLGDLRQLRGDVVHHRGILTKKTVTKLSVLSGFQEGTEIRFKEEDIEALVWKIKAEMDNLVVRAGGSDPKHWTIWHVQ